MRADHLPAALVDRKVSTNVFLRRLHNFCIGWGGYLGAEGEQIEFTLAQPRTARAR